MSPWRVLCWLFDMHRPTWAVTRTGYRCRACGVNCNQHGAPEHDH